MGNPFDSVGKNRPEPRRASFGKSNASSGFNIPEGTIINKMFERQDISRAEQQATENPFKRFNIPEEESSDYVLKPQFKSVHGMPIEEKIPELKKQIPVAQSTALSQGRGVAARLQNSANQFLNSENIRKRLGPQHPSAWKGFVGDMALKADSMFSPKQEVPDINEFSGFKSQVGQMLGEYLTYQTGAQRGFPEISFLKVDVPNTDDPPDIFYSKLMSSLNSIKINEDMKLEYLDQNDYRTRKVRGGFNYGIEDLINKGSQTRFNMSSSPVPGMPGYQSPQGNVNLPPKQKDSLGLFS